MSYRKYQISSIPIRKKSILIAYIVKSSKNQKSKFWGMDLPHLKMQIETRIDEKYNPNSFSSLKCSGNYGAPKK